MVYPRHPLLQLGVFFGLFLQEYRLPPEVHFPLTEESNTGDHRNTTRPLILFAAQSQVSPIAPISHGAIILHSVVPRTRPCSGLGTRGVGSVCPPPLDMTTSNADHLITPAHVNRFPPFETHSGGPLLTNPSGV